MECAILLGGLRFAGGMAIVAGRPPPGSPLNNSLAAVSPEREPGELRISGKNNQPGKEGVMANSLNRGVKGDNQQSKDTRAKDHGGRDTGDSSTPPTISPDPNYVPPSRGGDDHSKR